MCHYLLFSAVLFPQVICGFLSPTQGSPFVECIFLGNRACDGVWGIPVGCHFSLSTGIGSEVIFIWIRLHISAQSVAYHLRFEFPLRFWELDICLSYFWGWLWIFIIFHPDFIVRFRHIDQRPFYRILFSISLISYLRERTILRYNLFPL